MRTFSNTLVEADQSGVALGHFNVSELATLKAVAGAAPDIGVPLSSVFLKANADS